MIDIVPRLDKTQVFCDLDDFYQDFEANYANRLKLSTDDKRKPCQSKLCRVRSNDDCGLVSRLRIQNIQRILSE